MHKFKLLLSCCLFFLAIGPAFSQEPNSLQEATVKLEKIRTFAIGSVGFVGHTSEGEKLYATLLKEPGAKDIFSKIFYNKSATNEAKAYAACGLKVLDEKNFKQIVRNASKQKDMVSVLRVDILKKEEFLSILKEIDRVGCKQY